MLVDPAPWIGLAADRPRSEAAAAGSMRQKACHDVSRTSETPENVNFHASPRVGMDVSADDTGSRGGNHEDIATSATQNQE